MNVEAEIRYIKSRVKGNKKLLKQQIKNLDKSTLLATDKITEHQKATNNIQQRIDAITKEHDIKFLPKQLYDEKHDNLLAKISTLEEWKSEWKGKLSVTNLVSIIGLIMALLALAKEYFNK